MEVDLPMNNHDRLFSGKVDEHALPLYSQVVAHFQC